MFECDSHTLVFDDETCEYACVPPGDVPFVDEWWPVVDDHGFLCLAGDCEAGRLEPHYHVVVDVVES